MLRKIIPKVAIASLVLAAPTCAVHAQTFTLLYSFEGGLDAGQSSAPLLNVGGVLYGTSELGGGSNNCEYDCGTVFKLVPPTLNDTSWTDLVLYPFQNSNTGAGDGFLPAGGLTNVKGLLFGTTAGGGSPGHGTVFSYNPTSGIETVVYGFQGGADGAQPEGNLLVVGKDLYGTTVSGGKSAGCSNSYGCGTVFELSPSGSGWKESVIYTFQGGTDGQSPDAGLLNLGGVLYGTTNAGGGSGCISGCGTVFSLTPPTAKKTPWTESVIYKFAGMSDGSAPAGTLVSLNGALFGTAIYGGSFKACNQGCGTVFELSPPSSAGQAWTFGLVYSFTGGQDGAYPQQGVLPSGSVLYGTTSYFSEGLVTYFGNVFKLSPPSGGSGAWKKKLLHAFAESEGANPNALIKVGNTFYGTTSEAGVASAGCPGGCGTAFSLKP
jgi:uncharacterized repeat protein (TIGR03803 family)